ncbi:MAG: DNA-3-methyladenine glycosylase I [Verrucomicrobiota bacterium]
MSPLDKGLLRGPDGRPRCPWQGNQPDYLAYHDYEWGRPVADDFRLFEKICLEGFQAGLSWLTILRKREHFRRAFCGFDFHQVARFGPAEITRLLANPGIVRHRRKIEATIQNARAALAMVEKEGSLAAWFWQWEPGPPARPRRATWADRQAIDQTTESMALSRELKARGWTFVGPVTAYAFMQAMGLVNDHLEGCFVRREVKEERARFLPPSQRATGS